MQPWIKVDKNSDFSIYNLPFGIFSESNQIKRVGIAIGENIIDLHAAYKLGVFKDLKFDISVLKSNYLNDFIALGKHITVKVRELIQSELCDENSVLKSHPSVFINQLTVTMHLPVKVGDYTDFYSSIEHATNIGTMFRDPDNALLPNWKYLPVGYHGRASSIIVSGNDVYRPKGQVVLEPNSPPTFQVSTRVDFELEMAFIIGKNSSLGNSVSTNDADDYIFGKVLFNDWSARDIQKWEYVPLGPFLAKSFASSMSAWVVTLEALEPFKVDGPSQEPVVLPYLSYKGSRNYDINLEVAIQPESCIETIVSHSNFKYMYWTMAQQLAHHTVNGCPVNAGDMMGSGTISGPTKDSYGSMLELTWKGQHPIKLNDGSERKFINDFDTVIMRAHCKNDNIRIGFGECIGQIIPAK